MKAIELFAGIGGFRLGLEPVGIESIWANDLGRQCCDVYRQHFGTSSIIDGDIRELKDQVPKHDLLTAGFPCQPFSAAGKKQGIRDQIRGTLFAEIVDILKRRKPAYFILENVKRLLTMEDGDHFKAILTSLAEAGYLIEWRVLNTKNHGLAQNRERIFLVGKRDDSCTRLSIAEFESRGSLFLLPGELQEPHTLFPPACVADLMKPIADHRHRFASYGLAWQESVVTFDPPAMPAFARPVRLKDVLETEPPSLFDFTEITNTWLKENAEVNSFINGVQILSNQKGGARMGYTIFGIEGLAPTLTAATSRHYERYLINDRYRRLTNVEYARLQGFPDDWCESISAYDQYVLYGNAVPPPMVAWVARRLLASTATQPGRIDDARRKIETATART